MFTRQVRDALGSLYDSIHLQVHPLANLLALRPSPGEAMGEALRKLLWQTIESLRPPATVPPDRPEWLSYRLLWLYYVQAQSQQATCRELGLSERSFYRRLQEAVEAVASILWEQRCGAEVAVSQAEEAALDAAVRMRSEALQLASQAQRQPVELRAVLSSAQETFAPLAAQRNVALTVESPADLPLAYGDPAMFHQIVLNVLIEGLALTQKGPLRLVVAAEENETVWKLSGLTRSDAQASLEHADGLGVSRDLLQIYGGRFWLETDAQRQPVLAFAIPCASPTLIMVIDDDADTLTLYRRYLQAHYYVVQEINDQIEIGRQIAERRPDAILLDVLMPQRDGWELLQQLKTAPETAQIPVIICSVLSQPRLALALGAAEVLQKPISEEALLRALERVLATQHRSA